MLCSSRACGSWTDPKEIPWAVAIELLDLLELSLGKESQSLVCIHLYAYIHIYGYILYI